MNTSLRSPLVSKLTLGLIALCYALQAGAQAPAKPAAAAKTAKPAKAVKEAPIEIIPSAAGPKYGRDAKNPKLYVGPAGYQLDLAKCPADWNLDQGITATDISLYTTVAKSGPVAIVSAYSDGIRSYLNLVNDSGGIGGRKVTLDVKDSAYRPDLFKTNVDEALQAKKYAAFFGMQGTPHNASVVNDVNRECMPHLLLGSGDDRWADPVTHPWTTAFSFSLSAEANIWVSWLKTKFPKGGTVGLLYINNDYGKAYANTVRAALKGSNLKLAGDQPHDPAAPNIDNQFTTLTGAKADALVVASVSNFCTAALERVERGTWKPIVVIPAGCVASGTFKPLIDKGLTGNGATAVLNFKEATDPKWADDPIVQAYRTQMPKDGLDPNNTFYALGWQWGWFVAEILKYADSYTGGLNRANIAIAAYAIQGTNPWLLPGLTSKMNGLKDAYLIEGGQMVQYTVDDPKAIGRWVPSGALVNLEGKLGTYKPAN